MSNFGQAASSLCPDIDVSDGSFRAHMQTAFGEERFSDVTFKFSNGAEVLYAHRFILAARSPVMRHALLPGGEWEPQGDTREVRLDEGVDASTFTLLLKYMYTSGVSAAYRHVHSLMLLAHRFQVKGLVDSCEAYLVQNVNSDNIMMNLEVSEICGLAALRAKCLDKLQQGGLVQRLLDPDTLKKVALPGLRALLSLEPLPVEEYDLFSAVLRWSCSQVGEDFPDHPSPLSREAAELCTPLMELIRFPTMNGKELSRHVKAYNVVPPARYIEALEHLADVDTEADAPSPSLPRFRSRHPGTAHQTPRRKIATLSSEVARLSAGVGVVPPPASTPHQLQQPSAAAPAYAAAPVPPVASPTIVETPPRALPPVSQLGASPWTAQVCFLGL